MDELGAHLVDQPYPALERGLPGSSRSVKVDSREFEETLTRWALNEPLVLRPSQPGGLVRASYPSNAPATRWQRWVRKSFGGLCKPGQRREDCLSLLDDVMGMSERDKLGVALGMSLQPMKESISRAGKIRRAWNEFYRSHSRPTKQQILDFAAQLDRQFGALFEPPQ